MRKRTGSPQAKACFQRTSPCSVSGLKEQADHPAWAALRSQVTLKPGWEERFLSFHWGTLAPNSHSDGFLI